MHKLREVRDGGVSVLLVEQNVKAALALADRAAVLVEGRERVVAPCAELRGDARIAELYLGRHAAQAGALTMLQILADGLVIGSVMSLGAIGLTLTFSILRFANFGHGELLAWGAYAAFTALAMFTAVSGGTRADRAALVRLAAAGGDRCRRRRWWRCSCWRSTTALFKRCASRARSRW